MSTQPKFRTIELTLAAMFVALMAIGANITSWVPFLKVSGIPLTMQPFFAILAGLLLGSRLGALSIIVYTLVGIAGVPIFAEFSSTISAIIAKPSGGFIIAFILAAYVSGLIVEKKSNPTLPTFIFAAMIGIIVIYAFGTNFMYFAVNNWLGAEMGYATAWKVMLPFGIKDAIFTLFAALITPRLYKAVNKTGALNRLKNKDSVA